MAKNLEPVAPVINAKAKASPSLPEEFLPGGRFHLPELERIRDLPEETKALLSDLPAEFHEGNVKRRAVLRPLPFSKGKIQDEPAVNVPEKAKLIGQLPEGERAAAVAALAEDQKKMRKVLVLKDGSKIPLVKSGERYYKADANGNPVGNLMVDFKDAGQVNAVWKSAHDVPMSGPGRFFRLLCVGLLFMFGFAHYESALAETENSGGVSNGVQRFAGTKIMRDMKVTSTTATGNITLNINSTRFQRIDVNGANRDITLPAEENNAGLWYYFVNTSGANSLVVKNDAGSTIVSLSTSQGAFVCCSGSAWTGTAHSASASGFLAADGTITGATGQAQDFGTNGIKADAIVGSTAAPVAIAGKVGSTAVGNAISVTGGAGDGANNGGAASLVGGASGAGATGNGGAIAVTGGAAVSTNGTGGAIAVAGGVGVGTGLGGAATFKGGAGATNAAGGVASVTGGAGAGTGAGATASLVGGAGGAGATGDGGAALVTGGASGSTNGAGGANTQAGGVGTGTGAGGAVSYTGGAGAAAGAADGGAALIKGGASGTGATGAGGAATIQGGAAGSTNGAGGAIAVTAGPGVGSGAGGANTQLGGAAGATGAGGNFVLTAGRGGATSGNAGTMVIKAGAGGASSTGDGGVASLTAGASGGGATGAGGAASLVGGAGASTNGAGGASLLTGGAGAGTGLGGAATIAGGLGGLTNAVGGAASLTGGQAQGTGDGAVASVVGGASGAAGATGAGGVAKLVGGASVATNGAGGAAQVTGGAAAGSGAGGAVTLSGTAGGATGAGGNVTGTAGRGGATSGAAGVATLTGGQGGASATVAGGIASIVGGVSGAGATGNGGNAEATGGAAGSTNGSGGSVVLTPGALAGTGVAGGVMLRSSTGMVFKQYTAALDLVDTAPTLTAAQFINGIVHGQPTTGRAVTTPTGAAISAGCPVSIAVGDSFEFVLINPSVGADDIYTLTAGDGAVTFIGTVTLGPVVATTAPSSATWIFRNTGAGTWVGYRK